MDKIPPPKFKWSVDLEFFRKLTWKERLKLAAGHNLRVKVVLHTQHKTGAYVPMCAITTTADLEATPELAPLHEQPPVTIDSEVGPEPVLPFRL